MIQNILKWQPVIFVRTDRVPLAYKNDRHQISVQQSVFHCFHYYSQYISQMLEQCSVCSQIFDYNLQLPYKMCQNQHLLCIFCKAPQTVVINNCPECRAPSTFFTFVFKLYCSCDKMLRNVQMDNMKIEYLKKMEIAFTIANLLVFDRFSSDSSILLQLRAIVIKLMAFYDYQTAAHLLRRFIEVDSADADQQKFIGLGSNVENEGFCENKHIEWYENQYGNKISLYDMLGICCSRIDYDYQFTFQWAQNMRSKYPSNYRILYHLAVIQLNACHYDEAFILFGEVIELNRDFDKPYLMKAYIYNLADNLELMQQNAVECLKRDPMNLHAKYLIEASPNQSNQQIRSNMQKLLLIEPNYLKALLTIGKNSNIEKRIQIFEKCIKINDDYINAHIELSKTKCLAEGYQVARHILVILIRRNNRLAGQQLSEYYKSLGMIYEKDNKIYWALIFYKRARENFRINPQIYSLFIIQIWCLRSSDQQLILQVQEAMISIKSRLSGNTKHLNSIKKLQQILVQIKYYTVSAYFKFNCMNSLILFLRQQESYLLEQAQWTKKWKKSKLNIAILDSWFKQQKLLTEKYDKPIRIAKEMLSVVEPKQQDQKQVWKYRQKMIGQLQARVKEQCMNIDLQEQSKKLHK